MKRLEKLMKTKQKKGKLTADEIWDLFGPKKEIRE